MKNKILALALSLGTIFLVLGYFALIFTYNFLCYLHIAGCFIYIAYVGYKIWLKKLNKKLTNKNK